MATKSYEERWNIYKNSRANKPATDKSEPSEFFIWDRQFETGMPELDQQHQKLVQLINVLGRMLSAELESQLFEQSMLRIFDELAAYVDYHFRFEEDLMTRYHYDKEHFGAHIRAHADFIREIAEARNSTGDHPEDVAGRVLTMLSNWLINHILDADLRMAKTILALQSGLPEEQAIQQANSIVNSSTNALLLAMSHLYENLSDRIQTLLKTRRNQNREIEICKHSEIILRKFSRAVAHCPVSIIITNADGMFEYINPKFTQLTGYSLADLADKTPKVLNSGEMPTTVFEEMWKTITSGKEWHGELRNRKKNGEPFWDYVSISPIFNAEGKITHYVSIQENITERKLLEEMLRHQGQLSDDIINSLPGIFYMLNSQGRFIRMNPEFLEVTGYTKDELDHMHATDLFDGEDKILITQKIQEALKNGDSWAEAELIIKSGQRIPYYLTGHRASIDGQLCLVGIGTDITERRTLGKDLARQAQTDSLTGLSNRRHFLELAEKEIERARRYDKHLSGLMLDLDEFKSINDTHGHQIGDDVIRKVGEICRKTLRGIDIIGRFGGEEFAIILPESDAKQANEVAERLRFDIANSAVFLENGDELSFTASIGITTLTAAESDVDNMIKLANKALYEAKRMGRNRVCAARQE